MKTHWMAALAMVVPALAGASGDRIVVLATPGGPAVRAQLTETLCLSEECVAPDRVLSGGKLSWEKVAREHVVAVVQGHASNGKAGAQMQVEVLRADGHTAWADTLALNDANRLSVKDLVSASAAALGVIDNPASAQPARVKKARALAQRNDNRPSRRLALRPHPGHARG